MKYLIVLLFIFSLPAYAEIKNKEELPSTKHEKPKQGKGHKHDQHSHDKNHKMDAGLKKLNKTQALVKVQGMVCAFCAQGIEKNFRKRSEVEAVDVNLDKMEVLIKFKRGKSLDEKVIKEVVTGAGFQFKGIADAQ